MDAYVESKTHHPDILLLDLIISPRGPSLDYCAIKSRKAVLAIGPALKKLATDASLLAVAFCWASPTADGDIDPSCIQDYKEALAASADAFVGLSKRIAGPDEANRGGFCTPALRQNCFVKLQAREEEIIVVNTNFCFQRVEDAAEDDVSPSSPTKSPRGGSDHEAAISSIIRKDPSHQGYVLFSRQRFEELMELGNVNCINVYILLLLSAKYGNSSLGKELGSSFWGRRKIAEKLGLTPKMVLNATKKLHQGGLITADSEMREQPRGRSLSYLITDWKGEQSPKTAKNYFKLFRNLLGSSKSTLTSSPGSLRMWLYCLTRARALEDFDMQLKPGRLILDYDETKRCFGLSRAQTDALVKTLIDDDRVVLTAGMDGVQELEVRNWIFYQKEFLPTSRYVRKSGDPTEDYFRKMANRMEEDERIAIEKAGGKPAPYSGPL